MADTMIWALVILLLLLALALAPFVNEWRKPVVDDRLRDAAPGQVAELSDGKTYYRWHNRDGQGPVAVCVHGLTTPSFVWNQVAEGLVELGYRVLVYDLYGRGLSDRPSSPQTRAFFLRQLEELIAREGIRGDITLIGYSMGGAISSCYAAKHPGMLRRLVLVAPAGIVRVEGTFNRSVADLPVLGDWLFHALFPRRHRAASARLRDDQGVPADIASAQAGQVDWRGFVPAVLSSVRGMLSETLETEHRAIARAGVPVIAIWATADRSVPLSGLGRLADWNRDAAQAQVQGATHWLTITHPDEVVAAIRDNLRD